MWSWHRRSSASVVTPGTTCGSIMASTSAASCAARRALTSSSAERIGTPQPARELGPHQHLANLAVVQVGVHLGQHADTHPVLGLGVDGTAQRRAGQTQVFVHLIGNFDYAHEVFSMRNVVELYIFCIFQAH